MTGDRPFFRFLLTGALNTAFGYAAYAVFLAAGLAYQFALLAATVLGMTFNFFSFGALAFRARGGPTDFARFVLVYGAIFALNAGMLHFATAHLRWNPYLAQAACLPAVALIGYVALGRLVYGRIRGHGR